MKKLMIGVVAGLALAGGVAYATIPDANGVIHGCYKKSGDLRVIDPASTSKDDSSCKKRSSGVPCRAPARRPDASAAVPSTMPRAASQRS